jgi:NADPH-dependent 2,4-dienoyl-CoA reductase/sulfur reductase-like enzyme
MADVPPAAEGRSALGPIEEEDELRIADPALRPAVRIDFRFNGTLINAYQGETIASALAAAGFANLGGRRDDTPRGLWCGMGVCQECVVNVDGAPSLRACATTVENGMMVTTQGYVAAAPTPSVDPAPFSPALHRPQLLVVGAGPAGLSAARTAARCGVAVMIIDEHAQPGGQYFKQIAKSQTIIDPRSTDTQVRDGNALIADVEGLGVKIWRDATVWGAFGAQELAVAVRGEQHVFAPERLVLATGVYERGVPVPGWTLPGYMTTGAAQTLVRAYRVLPGRRILVAGNGPLNLQLAAELVAAGAEVVALVEAAERPALRNAAELLRAVGTAPGLIREGLRHLAALRRAGVPRLYGSAIVAARGDDRVEECTIARIDASGRPISGTATRFVVDTVCAGYGFLPSNEIARALGCRHIVCAESGNLSTVTDDDGLTSMPHVYAVGDAVAMRGAHAARCKGSVTGYAVARSLGLAPPAQMTRELVVAKRNLRRHLAFQQALWQIFAAPVLSSQFASADTVICRCESVTRATIDRALETGAATVGAVKRRTRLAMGRCQGRYCESVAAAMMRGTAPSDELSHLAPRVPAKPIRIKDLT